MPYTLAGETVEVEHVAGPSRSPAACCTVERRAPSASRRSARISASAAAARSSTGSLTPYRAWKRELVVDGAGAGRDRCAVGA